MDQEVPILIFKVLFGFVLYAIGWMIAAAYNQDKFGENVPKSRRTLAKVWPLYFLGLILKRHNRGNTK